MLSKATRSPLTGYRGRAVYSSDRGSTVYIGYVPVWATDELPGLYQSCYSVLDYFSIFEGASDFSACVLDDPRHIVLFSVRGHTAVVMNQLFDIDTASALRLVRAIFDSVPKVKRVRFRGSRVDFRTMMLPTRVFEISYNVVISLPADVDTYLAGLGRGTRQKLRNYSRRFVRRYPEYEFKVYSADEIDEALVHRIIEMNHGRMQAKGEQCLHTDDSEGRLLEFLRRTGFATAVLVDGRVVAGALGSRMGGQRYLHVQSFDNAFAEYHLGLVSLYLTLSHCIDDGADKLHLLWGRSDYKTRLGGVEEQVRAACVYRSMIWWLAAVDDVVHNLSLSWHGGRLAAARVSAFRWLGGMRHRSAP